MPQHRCIIVLFLLVHQAEITRAQQSDTLARLKSPVFSDDSIQHNFLNGLKDFRFVNLPKTSRFDSVLKIESNNISSSLKNSLIGFAGGYVAYNFNYRSNIDTPFVDRNVMQHNITGQFSGLVAGFLPLQVNYWIRKTNSAVFRDVADIRISANSYAFQQQIMEIVGERLTKLSSAFPDSLTEKLYVLKRNELEDLLNRLNQNFSQQRIAEAHEILKVPRLTWSSNLPDSINSRLEDSVKKAVVKMLQLYEVTKARYDSLSHVVDSLKKVHQDGQNKVAQVRQIINGGWTSIVSLRSLERKLKEHGFSEDLIPRKFRWLMGVRQLSVGRSTANYTELTAKNISVNGVNFEYNSWYYFAISAGLINFRFRDFAINAQNRKPQTFILARVGIGNLQSNYLIFSAYRGQKQLYASRPQGTGLVNISGLSAESRWQINRATWITAEIAKSMAPDVRNMPSQYPAKFDVRDNSNQAIAFRLHTRIPLLQTRIEGYYKWAGANFQSFSNFQTNAQQESWYLKAEQNFFKRKLRINAAFRKSEFLNPFIVQNYKSNSIFKTFSATLRMRKWPVMSVAYQPMSQFTKIDDLLVENRFQSLNATLYHFYKISHVRMASTVMFNKFYNNGSDTGFIYYNADNFYWTQQFFFNSFTTNVGASHTRNSTYSLTVLDCGIQPGLGEVGAFGIGVRVNSFNNDLVKVGAYLNANIKITKKDIIYLNYEHGYLPGFAQHLVKNETANIQFVKTF